MSNLTCMNNYMAMNIEELRERCVLLEHQNAELTAEVEWFMEQFKLAKHRQFGASSERTDSSEQQLFLFNEAEKESSPGQAEPALEAITYNRRKKKGHREAMLKELPEEIIEYNLPPEEQACPNCGSPLDEMSTVVRHELEVIPPKVKVVKHVRRVYSCRRCEREDISTPIVTAKAPEPVIPKSLASPSAVAHIMNSKYVDGLPLYRQEQQWSRLGVNLSRQTMANWVIYASDKWLEPLYHRLHELLLESDILQADETELQVLHEAGRKAQSKSFMWLYRTGRDGPPIVLFDYKTSRAGKHPRKFLAGFTGYLQVDGYSGYDILSDVTVVGCWAHARRKFDEALKMLPKDKRISPNASFEGLSFCNKLFAIERDLCNVSPEERYQARLKRSRLVLDEFLDWLQKQSKMVLPQSLLGKAVRYCLNQWGKLERFLLDGRLEIDNNRSERSIKPFVIGRKGWLFCNTPKGARASAVVYSIVETAKENGLIPFDYLSYLFEQLPNRSKDNLDELLPWSPSLPDHCRMTKNTASQAHSNQ